MSTYGILLLMKQRLETQTTEFKAVLNDKFEREVVAFLNSPLGGEIYRDRRQWICHRSQRTR
jgi:hypothetical protein